LYAKINDHGIRRGHAGRTITQWRHPVASRVALDLPYWYWVIRLAPHRLIRMAIKMACEAAARFSVVDFLCCITVDKYQNLKRGTLLFVTMYLVILYMMAAR